MIRDNRIDIHTEELIREASMVIADCKILRKDLRPAVQVAEIRERLKEFEDYMLDKCLEQGSDVIEISIMDFIELKNDIERIIAC